MGLLNCAHSAPCGSISLMEHIAATGYRHDQTARLIRQLVDVGCVQVGMPVAAKIIPAQLIEHEEQDILGFGHYRWFGSRVSPSPPTIFVAYETVLFRFDKNQIPATSNC